MDKDKLNIKVLGNRVAVSQLNEEEQIIGSIIVPQAQKDADYELGKVLSVDTTTYAKEGDLIMFQMPQKVKASSTYVVKNAGLPGDRFGVLHEDDILAVLTDKEIKLDTFQIAGKWVLCEMFAREDLALGLELPESYRPAIEEFRFVLRQKGKGCTVKAEVGDEVVLERQRLNPIKIDNKEYVFCNQEYVYGVVEDSVNKLQAID